MCAPNRHRRLFCSWRHSVCCKISSAFRPSPIHFPLSSIASAQPAINSVHVNGFGHAARLGRATDSDEFQVVGDKPDVLISGLVDWMQFPPECSPEHRAGPARPASQKTACYQRTDAPCRKVKSQNIADERPRSGQPKTRRFIP